MKTTSILLIIIFITLKINAQNTIINADNYAEISSNEVAELAKNTYSQPEFPGGNRELASYLSKNIKYPRNSRTASCRGKVIICFKVENNGTITEVKVTKGVNKILNKEAKRVVKNMPNWKPAIKNGKSVSEILTIPIVFFRN